MAQFARKSVTGIEDLWDRIRDSYWFIPTLMVLGAIGAGIGMVRLDFYLGSLSLDTIPWFGTLGGASSYSILSTVASSMATIAGVVFSITVVVLQLASSQFGPRLLRNYVVDIGNQISLGTFVSTFVYCLTVLASVRSGQSGFVPTMATTLAVLLGIISVGVLVFFINHIVGQIRIERILDRISAELNIGVDELFPEQLGHESDDSDMPRRAPEEISQRGRIIACARAGYLRSINSDHILSLAADHDLILALSCKPGDFVLEGDVLAWALPRERVDDAVAARLSGTFSIGSERTPLQDVDFVLRQLVQIALRALSPGINDPLTAIQCINCMTQALHRVAGRYRPSRYRADENGKLRVISPRQALMPLVMVALQPVARAGRDNANVSSHLLNSIFRIAHAARYEDDRAQLLLLARTIKDENQARLNDASEKKQITEAYAQAGKIA